MKETKICVIGLGYVGLPLARLFSTKFKTVGFDLNQARVDALMGGHDATLEVDDNLLQDAISNHGFKCTTHWASFHFTYRTITLCGSTFQMIPFVV